MDQRDRRGQLLLVAALGLAVAFVVLALVLNAVVFTENLATRNHGQSDDVLGFEQSVEDAAGGLVAQTNAHNATEFGDDDSNYEALDSTLHANVATWDGNASMLAAAGGHVTNATVVDVENGTRVVQADRRDFSNATGANDWTAAVDVEETRRFELVATPADTSDSLTVNVSNGSASWRVEIDDDGTDVTVTVFQGGSQVASHSEAGENVAVDVTAGRVNDTRVANWTFAEGVSAPYNVTVENGGNAEGRYGFVVDRERSEMLDDLPDSNYEDPDGDSPKAVPVLYAANVSVTAQDDRVTYETTVRVAPEQSPVFPVWVDTDA